MCGPFHFFNGYSKHTSLNENTGVSRLHLQHFSNCHSWLRAACPRKILYACYIKTQSGVDLQDTFCSQKYCKWSSYQLFTWTGHALCVYICQYAYSRLWRLTAVWCSEHPPSNAIDGQLWPLLCNSLNSVLLWSSADHTGYLFSSDEMSSRAISKHKINTTQHLNEMEWKGLSNRTSKKSHWRWHCNTNALDEDANTQEHVQRGLRHQNS
jgi:hypothetical protein